MTNVRKDAEKLIRIQTVGALRAIAPNWDNRLNTDYIQKTDVILNLASAIDNNATQTGSGDPNTAKLAANASLMYIDKETNDLWVNTTVGAKSGWIKKG